MKLNKIQQKIWNHYKKNDRTWVEACRISGKTQSTVIIATEELRQGNSVGVFTINKKYFNIFICQLNKN